MKCPVCGGEKVADAVFCADPACHKALGEFEVNVRTFRDIQQIKALLCRLG